MASFGSEWVNAKRHKSDGVSALERVPCAMPDARLSEAKPAITLFGKRAAQAASSISVQAGKISQASPSRVISTQCPQ